MCCRICYKAKTKRNNQDVFLVHSHFIMSLSALRDHITLINSKMRNNFLILSHTHDTWQMYCT